MHCCPVRSTKSQAQACSLSSTWKVSYFGGDGCRMAQYRKCVLRARTVLVTKSSHLRTSVTLVAWCRSSVTASELCFGYASRMVDTLSCAEHLSAYLGSQEKAWLCLFTHVAATLHANTSSAVF